MFGIGMPEFILILVVALIVIGPKKLPDLARSLGKAMGEFKKAAREFKDTMNVNEDVRELREIKKSVSDAWKDATKEGPAADVAPAGAAAPPDQAAATEAAAAADPGPATEPAAQEKGKESDHE